MLSYKIVLASNISFQLHYTMFVMSIFNNHCILFFLKDLHINSVFYNNQNVRL